MTPLKELAKKFKVKEEELLVRADGRVEWQCSHGIGHTIYAPPFSDFVHCCDRCCDKFDKILAKEKKNNAGNM